MLLLVIALFYKGDYLPDSIVVPLSSVFNANHTYCINDELIVLELHDQRSLEHFAKSRTTFGVQRYPSALRRNSSIHYKTEHNDLRKSVNQCPKKMALRFCVNQPVLS